MRVYTQDIRARSLSAIRPIGDCRSNGDPHSLQKPSPLRPRFREFCARDGALRSGRPTAAPSRLLLVRVPGARGEPVFEGPQHGAGRDQHRRELRGGVGDLPPDRKVVRPRGGPDVDSAIPGVAAWMVSRNRGPHLHGGSLLFGVDRLPVLAGLFRRKGMHPACHCRLCPGGGIQALDGAALSSAMAVLDPADARNPAGTGDSGGCRGNTRLVPADDSGGGRISLLF